MRRSFVAGAMRWLILTYNEWLCKVLVGGDYRCWFGVGQHKEYMGNDGYANPPRQRIVGGVGWWDSIGYRISGHLGAIPVVRRLR